MRKTILAAVMAVGMCLLFSGSVLLKVRTATKELLKWGLPGEGRVMQLH